MSKQRNVMKSASINGGTLMRCSFPSSIKGILSGGVIGGVDYFFHFGNELANALFHALFERHVHHTAAMAAASKTQIHLISTTDL